MPLKKGKSPKTISRNIRELHHGAQYKRTRRRHGKAAAHQQAIAIAENQARRY